MPRSPKPVILVVTDNNYDRQQLQQTKPHKLITLPLAHVCGVITIANLNLGKGLVAFMTTK